MSPTRRIVCGRIRSSAFAVLLLAGAGFLRPGPLAGQVDVEFDPGARPLAWLRTNCLPMSDIRPGVTVQCTPTGLRRVGVVDETAVWAALYRRLVPEDSLRLPLYDTPPYHNTAIVMFSGPVGAHTVRPVWASSTGGYVGVWFEDPELVLVDEGWVLFVPVRSVGTSHPNYDRYFLWRDGGWTDIDSRSWRGELMLPPEHAIWKDVVIDLREMKLETPVWRTGDANCCPTGGHLVVEMELEGDRLRVAGQRYTADEMDAAR